MERLELAQAKFSSLALTYGYFPLAAVIIVTYALIQSTYLLYLYPLSKVPGLKWAAITNIPYGMAWMSGRYPWAMEKLFRQYGNVVRCALNEVCFISPEAYAQIYTSSERGRPTFLKSDLLDDPLKYPGLISVKDVDEHRAARRIFQPAFNSRLYPEYTPVINKYITLWLSKLERISAAGNGLDMTHWMEYLMADISGILIFRHEFKNVESGDTLERGATLLKAIDSMGWWGTVRVTLKRFLLISWVQWILIWPPALMAYIKSINTNVEAVAARIKKPDYKQKDYLTLILTEGGPLPLTEYLASHLTNILYGHVETATILTAAIYFLCMHPEVHSKLAKELRDNFHPGVEIDGYYIPRGTVYFKKACEYCPERWLPRIHSDYNEVFSDDNYDAMMLCCIIGRLCWKYDWEMLNKGEVYWERDVCLFTVWLKPLIVVCYYPVPST
ncbi:cytochrome P450 [Trichoderma barbatum]